MSTTRLAAARRRPPPTDVRAAILAILKAPRWIQGGALGYWTREAIARHPSLEGVAPWRVQVLVASLLIMGEAEELAGGRLVLRPPALSPAPRPRR